MQNHIGACGLNCSKCKIYNASVNKQLAEEISDLLFQINHLEVEPRKIRCIGCKNEPRIEGFHWSWNCKILECCLDDKNFENCGECADFPCEKLVEASKKSKKKKDALEYLRKLKIDQLQKDLIINC